MSDGLVREVRFSATDGTILFARDCGPMRVALTPLLCLPGLTRNHRDFAPVAQSFGHDRRVVALDFRGRGNSAWADPKTYRPDVEMADTLALLDYLGLERVAVLGSSRGGLVGMLMGNLHPERMAGLMLNDVGPVIEVESLKRIAGYVGKAVSYRSWDDAAEALAQGAIGFHDVPHSQWLDVAQRILGEKNGVPCTEHDPGLAVNFPTVAQLEAKALPDSWKLFDGLSAMPVGVLRGDGSDLLSAETVAHMRARRHDLAATVIAKRGHIPFLDEPESVEALSTWLAQVDSYVPSTPARPAA